MAEREIIITADQLIESLKLADQYEQKDYDNWALAVRLSVGNDIAKLSENEKKRFLARVKVG